MTKNELRTIFHFIERLKVTKIEDKATRGKILALHLEIYKTIKSIEEDINEARKALVDGYEEELGRYNDFRAKIAEAKDDERRSLVAKMAEECPHMKAAESELVEAVERIGREEVGSISTRVPLDGFIDACEAQGIDLTCADVAFLSPIFENE